MTDKPVLELFGGDKQHPPVVLLHAYPVHRAMWRGQVESLSEIRRVITVDLPGFGESKELPAQITESKIEDVARLVLDRVRGMGISKFTWMGCSMGGYLIMEVLRQAPQAVAHLILCDTRADADSDETRQKRKDQQHKIRDEGTGWLGGFVKENLLSANTVESNPEWANELARQAAMADPETILYYLDLLAGRPDSRSTLKSCSAPTLLLCGEHDKVTPLALHEEMRTLLKNSSLEIVPQAGHLSPAENPAFVNEAIRKFLAAKN